MLTYLKLNKTPLLTVFLSIVFYVSFAYYLDRADFIKLCSLYVALFYFAFKLIKITGNNFTFLLIAGIVFRLVFIAATPNLSQDFYRFIWDGKLLLQGINPYQYTPDFLITTTNFNDAYLLHEKMGWLSASHYSNYPPLAQLYFALSVLMGLKTITGSVIVMRLLLILADIGILIYAKKILEKFNLPKQTLFWYFLNPLIIIEITGNLHFEALMLLLLSIAIYYLAIKKNYLSVIAFSGAVLVKLLPLVLLPIIWRYLGLKKGFIYCLGVIVISISTFMLFTPSQLLENYAQTLSLWFINFEFNASIYYLVREIGMHITGYNIIKTAGPILSVITLLIILVITLKKPVLSVQQLFKVSTLAITIYLFFATTVHPWYLSTLLLLSVFCNYKYPYLWSLLIILSYITYSNPLYEENLWMVTLQYTLVYSLFIYELVFKKSETIAH